MQIITGKMVEKALELAKPTIEIILKQPGTTWGPQWVNGYLSCPGITEDIPFTFGEETEWDHNWGAKRDFWTVAGEKLELARRMGEDTSKIIASSPWLIEPGEFLYPGGAIYLGISAGTSGAMGWVDELISSMIIEIIIMLAHLETDRRIAAHEMKI